MGFVLLAPGESHSLSGFLESFAEVDTVGGSNSFTDCILERLSYVSKKSVASCNVYLKKG